MALPGERDAHGNRQQESSDHPEQRFQRRSGQRADDDRGESAAGNREAADPEWCQHFAHQ